MATLSEGIRTAGFMGELPIDIGAGADKCTIITGQNLSAGTVVGKITASSKFTILAPAAADGSQTAAGIIFDNVNATAADKSGMVLLRGPAQVNQNDLTWPVGITAPQKTAAIAQLLALGIKLA